MADDSVKFFIVSESKPVKIHGRKMEMADLVRFWLETLHLGYRLVNTKGGYVTQAGDHAHEQSYELTVNAPIEALPKLKLLARCIARLADQGEVWIETRGETLKIGKGYDTMSNCECTKTPAGGSRNEPLCEEHDNIETLNGVSFFEAWGEFVDDDGLTEEIDEVIANFQTRRIAMAYDKNDLHTYCNGLRKTADLIEAVFDRKRSETGTREQLEVQLNEAASAAWEVLTNFYGGR
jgi:hypothetical protein